MNMGWLFWTCFALMGLAVAVALAASLVNMRSHDVLESRVAALEAERDRERGLIEDLTADP